MQKYMISLTSLILPIEAHMLCGELFHVLSLAGEEEKLGQDWY
jgi:hypothetical protein